MRFCVLLLCLPASLASADDPVLPSTAPPFTLGDLSVVQTLLKHDYTAFKLTCFGRRHLHVTGGENIGDGITTAKQVSSGFMPVGRRTYETALSSVRVWNRAGAELTADEIAELTARPTRAVVLRSPIDNREEFVAYSLFFAKDALFVYPGRMFQVLIDARNSGRRTALPAPKLPGIEQ